MPARADEHLQGLIRGLLHVNPKDRWDLATVLECTWCSDASALDVNLTEVLSPLAKKDDKDKKTLMLRYMEESEDNSDDEVSEASTAEDNHDKLDQERERMLDGIDGRRQAPGTEQDAVQKMNQALRSERVQKKTQDLPHGCVVC